GDGAGDRRGRQGPEEGSGDAGAKRTTLQLVQGVGADAQREQEGKEGKREAARPPLGGQGSADDDVAQVPEGVGGVEEAGARA
ncbi:MAG: hypothetical protein C4305_05045, partial [Thermoleophilia bacterium]